MLRYCFGRATVAFHVAWLLIGAIAIALTLLLATPLRTEAAAMMVTTNAET